jgi:hypothetical protein
MIWKRIVSGKFGLSSKFSRLGPTWDKIRAQTGLRVAKGNGVISGPMRRSAQPDRTETGIMKFFRLFKRFHGEEDGAVTVDWVVLTAAVVGLGVAALAAIRAGTGALVTRINDNLAAQTINTTFTP